MKNIIKCKKIKKYQKNKKILKTYFFLKLKKKKKKKKKILSEKNAILLVLQIEYKVPFQICIGSTLCIGRESWCLPYAGFLITILIYILIILEPVRIY